MDNIPTTRENLQNMDFNYTLLVMANSPHPETVTVSFTLPRALSDAVDRKARTALTNKSDIIRRALLAYLPASEAEEILRGIEQSRGPSQEAATSVSTPPLR